MKNYWISIDDAVYDDAMSYFADADSYAGAIPVEDIDNLSKGLHDPKTVLGLFKPYNGQHLFTVYVTSDALYEGLKLKYPNSVEMGGWLMDGTRIVDIHPDLINFMPDKYDDEDNAYSASEITQVNLLSGQTERAL